VKHARYYWLLLAESGLTRRLFGAMVRTLRSDAWAAAPNAALRQQGGKMRREPALEKFLAAMAGVLACATAQAQWSIGAPGNREAPAGRHRYVMLVFANPIPGREVEFNEWYTNTHMGDLVQLDGWVGAQRFRIVTNVQPRPTAAGYAHGYLIIWDLEEADANLALARMTAAISGGKSRLGAAFNYTPGAGANGTFEAISPRMTRPDRKGPSMPNPSDNRTSRPNRYVLMEFENALPGKDAEFQKAATQKIPAMLSLPGWMAAQRFRMADTPGRPSVKPKYLTVWETEGATAQSVNETLQRALQNGTVLNNPAADMSTAELVYWEPITPYLTKQDFVR